MSIGLRTSQTAGRLTADPEHKAGGAHSIVTFSIAVNRIDPKTGEPDADYWDCVAFGNRGDFIKDKFRKGDWIQISGRDIVEKWVDREGNNRRNVKTFVSEVGFGPKQEKSGSGSRTNDSGGAGGSDIPM